MARQSEEILLCDETRVILRNVIFIANIPWILCNDKILSSQKYFGQFGDINQVCVSKSYHDNINNMNINNSGNFGAAYIQYYNAQSAMDAISTFSVGHKHGHKYVHHIFRVNYAVNKLCSYFLNNEECPNTANNCRYIHYEPNPNDIVYQHEIDQYFHGQCNNYNNINDGHDQIIDNISSAHYRVNGHQTTTHHGVNGLYINLEHNNYNNDDDQINDDIDTPSETSPKPFLFPAPITLNEKPSYNQFVLESQDTMNNNNLHRGCQQNNNKRQSDLSQLRKTHEIELMILNDEIKELRSYINNNNAPKRTERKNKSKRMDYSVIIENQMKLKQNKLESSPPTDSGITCNNVSQIDQTTKTDGNMDVNDLHIQYGIKYGNNRHKMEYNELEKEHQILKTEHDRLRKKHCKLIRDYNILEQNSIKSNTNSKRSKNKNNTVDYKTKCSKMEEKLKQMSQANNILTAHLNVMMHQHKNYQILEHENLWLKHELETSQKSQTELSELMFNVNTDNQSLFNYASLSPSRCPSVRGYDNDVSLNMNDIKQWDWLNIYQWINSLRNGKFIKYNHSLSISLRQENVDGLMLMTLNQNDLYRLGINNHNDCSLLMDDIHHLLNINHDPDNNNNNRKYDASFDNDLDPFDLNQFRDVLNVAIVNDIEGDLFSNTFEIEGGILV